MTELANVRGEDFSLHVAHDGTKITITMTGNADGAAVDTLHTIVEKVHVDARRLAVTETVVDMTQLEFMNSSCFKAIVSWIAKISDLDETKRYKLCFVSNSKTPWQRRSLHSLSCFATDLITIVEK